VGMGSGRRQVWAIVVATLLAVPSPGAAREIGLRTWDAKSAATAISGERVEISAPGAIATEVDTRTMREVSFRVEGRCRPRARLSVDGESFGAFTVPPRERHREVPAKVPAGQHSLRLELDPRAGCSRARAVIHRTSVREWVPIGSDMGTRYMEGDQPYQRLVADHVDSVTAGTDMQWSEIEPARGVFDFTGADQVVDFAEVNGLAVRGHPLVWRQFLPGWLRSGNWTRDELIEVMRNHIQTIVGRYRGRVAEWDVVNEAVEGNGTLRRNFWYRRIGPDYIELAFRFAHEADPGASLYYNDYDTEVTNTHSSAVHRLVSQAVARGTPIDGVGFQYHVNTDHWPQADAMAENFGRFADLGVEVQVTEADVPDYSNDPDSPERRRLQSEAFRAGAQACKREPACTRFTMWGLTDRYSWLGTEHRPLPFDRFLDPKPAWDALTDVLRPRG
jgi:endo-1,4-beta-xylanase